MAVACSLVQGTALRCAVSEASCPHQGSLVLHSRTRSCVSSVPFVWRGRVGSRLLHFGASRSTLAELGCCASDLLRRQALLLSPCALLSRAPEDTAPKGWKFALCPSAMAAASSSEPAKTALVAVADGTEEMEAVIAIDVLRRAGVEVTVASVEPQLQVTASRKVKLVADKLIGECEAATYDLIVIPGGMPGAERLRDSAPLRQLAEAQNAEGREVAAICAAPVVALSTWGLLKGRQATAHPAFSDKLEESSAVATRVVEDGNITTSRGPGTAFEFSLRLVERLFGAEKAAAVAGPMVMTKGGPGEDRWRLDVGPAPAPRSSAKVLVPVANGSEEMEAVIVVDVLRRAGAEVVVASVENSLEVIASRKVKLVADVSIKEAAQASYDLIVLPGGMPGAERLRDSPELEVMTRAQAAGQRPLAAICAAPVVALQAQGLLEGKKATAHPAFSGKLADQGVVDARVVRDGLVVTSRGPGTAMEFALALVELLFGEEKAKAVAAPMVTLEIPEKISAK